jgi:hypothetical protein
MPCRLLQSVAYALQLTAEDLHYRAIGAELEPAGEMQQRGVEAIQNSSLRLSIDNYSSLKT